MASTNDPVYVDPVTATDAARVLAASAGNVRDVSDTCVRLATALELDGLRIPTLNLVAAAVGIDNASRVIDLVVEAANGADTGGGSARLEAALMSLVNSTVENSGGATITGSDRNDGIWVQNDGNGGIVVKVSAGGTTTETHYAAGTLKGPLVIDAGGGDDLVWVYDDVEVETIILGGDGNDQLVGGAGGGFIIGGSGGDYLEGGSGAEYLLGGEGNDSVYGGGGNDVLLGGTDLGSDYLDGGSGDDTLWGGAGVDQLSGGRGADTLYGEAGDDALIAGPGADHYAGGLGLDLVYTDGADTPAGAANPTDLVTEVDIDESSIEVVDLSALSAHDQERATSDLITLASLPAGAATLAQAHATFGTGGIDFEFKVTEGTSTYDPDTNKVSLDRRSHGRGASEPDGTPFEPDQVIDSVAVLDHELIHAVHHGNETSPDGVYTGPNPDDLPKVVKRDTDGDGKVDQTETIDFDGNGDGVVTPEEFMEVVDGRVSGKPDGVITEDELDLNGDGRITNWDGWTKNEERVTIGVPYDDDQDPTTAPVDPNLDPLYANNENVLREQLNMTPRTEW